MLSELYIHAEILLEIPLFLLAKRRHFFQFDNSGPINLSFLLLTAHKSSIEDIANKQIFAYSLRFLKLESDISGEVVFLSKDDDVLFVFFDMECVFDILGTVDDFSSGHVDKFDIWICEAETAFER